MFDFKLLKEIFYLFEVTFEKKQKLYLLMNWKK